MLELGKHFVSFEPDNGGSDSVGNVTENFFDTANSKICTMRNNGALGLTAKSLCPNDVISVRTKDRGVSRAVKISPDGKLALLQRTSNSVDVLLLTKNDGSTCIEFPVASKSKEDIMNVEWITSNQILFVTRQCLELFALNVDKRNAKLLKTLNIATTWSQYYARANILTIASGPSSSTLRPVTIRQGTLVRLKEFTVDFGASSSREHLLEKDVTIGTIYGKVYVMVLRYSVRSSLSTDLVLYELSEDANAEAKLRYSLVLGCTGGFGIHIIDNLVIVHHQSTAKSLIFDVAFAPARTTHSALITTPIVPCANVKPQPLVYSPFWTMFQPDIIVDPTAGIMYQLVIKFEKLEAEIPDSCARIEFLLHRSGIELKQLLLNSLMSSMRSRSLTLRQLRKLFDIMVDNGAQAMKNGSTNDGSRMQQLLSSRDQIKITQEDLHRSLLIPLMDDDKVDKKYVANAMLQYLGCLQRRKIPVEAFFSEMLVSTFAEAGSIAQLQQLVAYKVIDDSKPLAFLLISFEARCPSLYQSGIDILARQKAVDEVVEVMLDKRHVVDAVRYLDSRPNTEANVPKITEGMRGESRSVQYAIYKHFEDRKVRGDATAMKKRLKALYSEDEIEQAELEVASTKITPYQF